jgi:hypothetical protein
MFPTNWGAYDSNMARKKQKTYMEHLEDKVSTASSKHESVPFTSDLRANIERTLRSTRAVSDGNNELDLDSILSRLPYRDILQNLFGNAGGEQRAIPVITKVYEESFMRQPFAREQPCVMGNQCECMFIDKKQAFIGVEFRLSVFMLFFSTLT